MNLQSQISEVRTRISEMYADDQADQNITDNEIVQWINQSEFRIHYDLTPEALGNATTGVMAETSLTSGGTGYVTLPSAPLMLRPVSVSLSRASGHSFKTCKIVSYEDYLRAAYDPNWRSSFSQPIAAFRNNSIYTSPWISGQTVKLVNVIHPQPRYRHFMGTVTSKTSNTIWADAKAVAEGWPDDYFITEGYITCQLKFTSGEPNGRTVNVTDYTGATGTFTTATTTWPLSQDAVSFGDVNVGDSYEVGQVSQLPEVFELAMFAYVEHQAFRKDREEMAASALELYHAEIKRINDAYSYATQGGRS